MHNLEEQEMKIDFRKRNTHFWLPKIAQIWYFHNSFSNLIKLQQVGPI